MVWKAIIATTALLCLGNTPQQSKWVEGEKGTFGWLYAVCSSTDFDDGAVCGAYFMGFRSGQFAEAVVRSGVVETATICPPDGVTLGQMSAVFQKYGRNNPELYHEAAGPHVWKALSDAWPCG